MSRSPSERLPLLDPKGRFRTWVRYHWWVPALHLTLVLFAAVNIYPFFWMLGTSLKAEAEASNDRMSPFPKLKYKLADDFDAMRVLPIEMEPELKLYREEAALLTSVGETEPPSRVPPGRKRCAELLDGLLKRLELVHEMQKRSQPVEVAHAVSRALKSTRHPRVVNEVQAVERAEEALKEAKAPFEEAEKRAEKAAEPLKKEIKRLRKELDEVESPSEKEPLKESLDAAEKRAAAEAEAREEELAPLRAPVNAAQSELDARKAELDAALGRASPEVVEGFVSSGLLEESGQGLWLTEKALAEEPPVDGRDRKVLDGASDHLTVGVKEFSTLGSLSQEESAGTLASLGDLGVLAEARKVDEGPRYLLAPGARGRITDGLYPRQILTLWSMRRENVRRSESRETYAKDRRSPGNYSEKYVKDAAKAESELGELVEKGYLVRGTYQPINYWVVLKEENFLLHFMTSLIMTAFVVIGTVLLSSMLGYALASIRFPGKFLVLGVIITASILPGEARIIPIFKMLKSVGAMGNLWGMVLWLTSFGVGNALLMAGFFLTLPKEVYEAAEVDGAGPFRTFFDVALPMARPIVMTVGLFAFLGSWNNFLVPLLCTISRPSLQPLAVAVYTFQEGHPGKWHQINAAASIMIIPVIIMFLMVQKHVVKSIAVGAVKG